MDEEKCLSRLLDKELSKEGKWTCTQIYIHMRMGRSVVIQQSVNFNGLTG